MPLALGGDFDGGIEGAIGEYPLGIAALGADFLHIVVENRRHLARHLEPPPRHDSRDQQHGHHNQANAAQRAQEALGRQHLLAFLLHAHLGEHLHRETAVVAAERIDAQDDQAKGDGGGGSQHQHAKQILRLEKDGMRHPRPHPERIERRRLRVGEQRRRKEERADMIGQELLFIHRTRQHPRRNAAGQQNHAKRQKPPQRRGRRRDKMPEPDAIGHGQVARGLSGGGKAVQPAEVEAVERNYAEEAERKKECHVPLGNLLDERIQKRHVQRQHMANGQEIDAPAERHQQNAQRGFGRQGPQDEHCGVGGNQASALKEGEEKVQANNRQQEQQRDRGEDLSRPPDRICTGEAQRAQGRGHARNQETLRRILEAQPTREREDFAE